MVEYQKTFALEPEKDNDSEPARGQLKTVETARGER
jgi:hypothetical protein